jgi:hypothetical protein
LEVISSGISINVQNKVNHKILFIIPWDRKQIIRVDWYVITHSYNIICIY